MGIIGHRLRSAPAIGISGSYGGLNVGDEAILTVVIEELRSAVPDVELTVFTRDVDHTRANHDVEHVIDGRDALRDELSATVEELDLLLIGGGGILYDGEAEYYLHLPRIAQRLGVRTGTFAIGAGPLERRDQRRAVAEVVNGMSAITVRDARSCRLLEEIGAEPDIVVTADPAVLLRPAEVEPSTLEREGIDPERRVVGMSVREPGNAVEGVDPALYRRLLANAADFVAARFDADVLFVPMERADVGQAHRVIGDMGLPDRAAVLTGTYGPRELLAIVGRLDMAIGMRLHFLIFAALSGVPLLPLPYASKVSSFASCLGLSGTPAHGPEAAGTLLAEIDRTWDLRHAAGRRISDRVRKLQSDARRTAPIVTRDITPPVFHAPARSA